MLSLFARRVTLSAYRSTATYARILTFPASTLRDRRIPDTSIHPGTVQASSNFQRNASTKATAATGSLTKSAMAGRMKPRRSLTPEEKAAREQKIQAEKEEKLAKRAALRAKLKAQAEKKKEAAALKRERLAKEKKEAVLKLKRLVEKEKEATLKRKRLEEKKKEAAALRRKRLAEAKKKLAEAKKAKAAAEKAKKPKIIKPPPRSITAFSLFIQEAGKPVQLMVADWRNLSEEAKQEYIARATAITKKRREEFDAFMKTVSRGDLIRYNRFRRRKGERSLHVKRSNRPQTSFMRYIQIFRTRPDQAGKSQVEVAKAAGEGWRSLTQEEKDQYRKHNPTESTTA